MIRCVSPTHREQVHFFVSLTARLTFDCSADDRGIILWKTGSSLRITLWITLWLITGSSLRITLCISLGTATLGATRSAAFAGVRLNL